MITSDSQENFDQEQAKSSDSIEIENSPDSKTDKSIDKVCVKIQKQRKKRRVRLQWVPILTKGLETDQEPVFISNYVRMMKNYDSDQLNKFKNYGFQDAGIGIIQQITLDKINQTIDLSMITVSEGQYKFNDLIQLYKSYQNQKCYDLALILEEYQEYSSKRQVEFMNSLQTIQSVFTGNQLDLLESEFENFEVRAKQWAETKFSAEIYELVIGNVSLKYKIPTLKKQIFSKNLIYLLGSSLERVYNDFSGLKNKDLLSNLVKCGDINGDAEIDKTIKIIRETINQSLEYEMEDELITLEGYAIPIKRKIDVYFHDLSTKVISKIPHGHFIIASVINIEPHWLQFLIQKRSENQMNHETQLISYGDQEVYGLDYCCQQEYFLEKYYSEHKKQYQQANK